MTCSNLEKLNRLISFQIENFMAQAFNNIAVLSSNPILISQKTSLEEKSTELKKIYKYYQLFQDITILDPTGRVIASTGYRFYGRWELNYWFLEVKEKKEIIASDVYAALSFQEPVLAFFSPILDEKGEIIFFLVAQINTESFWQIINFKIGKGGYVFLINQRGDIIFHPEKSLLFEKIPPQYSLKENSLLKKGVAKFSFQNENLIAYFNVLENYQQYPGHNWHLILVQPEKEAFSFLKTIKKQIFLFLILSLVLIFFISFLSGRYINRPFEELIRIAREVAKSNFQVRAEIKTRDEFGQFAKTFNKMIEELKISRLSLEEVKQVLEIKVQARTRELKELSEKQEEIIKEKTKTLQERIAELEKFHRLAVGRELKMIELKKEIKKLREELEKKK